MSTIQEKEKEWSEASELLDTEERMIYSIGSFVFGLVTIACILGALIKASPFLATLAGGFGLVAGYCAYTIAMDGLTRVRLLRDELQDSYRREEVLVNDLRYAKAEINFLRPQVDNGRLDAQR
jgi:hypothetical protein